MQNLSTAWVTRWGGICQGRFEADIPPGMFKNALNYYLSPTGAIIPRPGFSKLIRLPDGFPPIAIYPVDWDGALNVFVATKSHVYRMAFDATETPGFTLIHTWATTATRATFAPINTNTAPHIVFGNGKDFMQKFDGATSTALPADSPKGFPVAYKNYLAVFGIPEFPGRVQFNINNGDTDTWLYGGIPRTLELQGAVKAVYPFTGLLIFTDRRCEMFMGDPDAPQGQSVLSETVGCVEHKTVVEAEGRLIWLSFSGVTYWNGSGTFPTGILSDPEGERASNISEDIRRFSWKDRELFSFAYNPITRQLLASVRIVKADMLGTEFRTYNFDLYNQAWFPWDLEAYCVATCVSPTSSRTKILAGFADGTIGYAEPGYSNIAHRDVSETVTREFDYSVRSGALDLGTVEYDKDVRAVTLRICPSAGFEGVREIFMSFMGDFIDTGYSDTFELRFGFVLGIGKLGDFISGIQDMEARRPVAIRSKFFSWQVVGKGAINSMPIQALGISFKPHSKRSTMIWNRDI